MNEVTLYHNPRCSKSRQTLLLLKQQGIEPVIVEYLKTPPTPESLSTILKQLGMTAHELVRKEELVYKELNLKANSHREQLLIQAMCDNPKLIERPIVIYNEKAKNWSST